ncbi:MAG: hypothetical protein EA422_10780 [Gemmatimonadales bacterium]|nr:MAG: hypothetical protein EA422_10780 [Gemmatimonadales bacterium]
MNRTGRFTLRRTLAFLLFFVGIGVAAAMLAADGPRSSAPDGFGPDAGMLTVSDSSDTDGRWVTADLHMHTCLTDGDHPFHEVKDRAVGFGLDVIANSEHGGAYTRDENCIPWDDRADVEVLGGPPGGAGEPSTMWRWQSLEEHAWPQLEAARTRHPDRLFALGLEWNPPGADHVSVGIVRDGPEAIATFARQFDRRIADLDGPEDALRAIRWLDQHHRGRAWVLPAHPERSGSTRVEDLRAWNDAAPDVAFGFEGAPGAQSAPIRGGFRPERAMGGTTWGGVGFMAAPVGGIWDALLGEGREFWLFASSDFHRQTGAFWPGEYTRTHIWVTDHTLEAVVAGMRSGRAFITHGHLVDELEIRVVHEGVGAYLGGTIRVPAGATPELIIRWRSPLENPAGDAPEVAAVQVIRGDRTARAHPNTPAWSSTRNPTTRIETLLRASEAREVEPATEAKGPLLELRVELEPISSSGYLRVRGTNHEPDTPLHTDPDGSPLPDAVALSHWMLDRIFLGGSPPPASPEALLAEAFRWGEERAWSDLWFYANPIFMDVVEDE